MLKALDFLRLPSATSGIHLKSLSSLADLFSKYSRSSSRATGDLIDAYNRSPWLRAVTMKVAQHVASTEWVMYRSKNKGLKRKLSNVDAVQKRAILKNAANELKEVAEHPFLDFLSRGGGGLDGFTALYISQLYLEFAGEFFWVVEKNKAGKAHEFWVIPPNWIKDIPDNMAEGGYFDIQFPEGKQLKAAKEDVLWVKQPNVSNPYGRGSGLGGALADELDLAENVTKHVANFFYNGALPQAIIAVEGANQNAVTQFATHWLDKHRGVNRAHEPAFVGNKVTVSELGSSLSDLQISEIKQWERDVFHQIWGVPPELLGIVANSNRATITQARSIFAAEVIEPRVIFIQRRLQAMLDEIDPGLILDHVSNIPDDQDYKLEVMRSNPGAFRVKDWKEAAGLPYDEQDNVYLVEPTKRAIENWDELNEMAASPYYSDPLQLRSSDGVKKKSPLVTKALTNADVIRILESIDDGALRTKLLPVWNNEVKQWIADRIAEYGLSPDSVDLQTLIVQNHIKDFSLNRLREINDTTRAKMQDLLKNSLTEGDSIPQIASKLRQQFDVESYRAKLIARTESLRSSNFASYAVYSENGIEGKEYIATNDGRVRDEHLAADGQVVRMDAPFTLGDGTKCMFAGQSGVAKHDCNCRCTFAPVADMKSVSGMRTKEQRVEIWKRFDRELVRWENKVEKAVLAAFEAQLDAALDELDRV